MPSEPLLQQPALIQHELGAIFVSLELNRTSWITTSLSPGAGEKMSRRQLPAGDTVALLATFQALQIKAFARLGRSYPLVVIQEAGLDGFWIHRLLERESVESHVVDPASITTSRRRRRAKTDSLDGEALVRALLAYKRGEPRVCAMARAPSVDEEDQRQVTRERRGLTASGWSTSTGSRACSSLKACRAMSPFGGTDVSDWRACTPGTAAPCLAT